MVFGTHGRGSQDWLESRVPEQDVIIEDILSALARLDRDIVVHHDPIWIVPYYVNDNEIDDPSSHGRGICVNVSDPLVLQADACEDLFIVDSSSDSSGNDSELSTGESIIVAAFVVMGTAILV